MNRYTPIKILLFSVSIFALSEGYGGQTTNKPQGRQKMSTRESSVRFIDRAPAGYSHVVEVRGGRTLYIAGQIALDGGGNLVGAGDFRAQIRQVFSNLNSRLKEAGAQFKDVVKLNYYITDASDLQALRETRDSFVNKDAPPASTLVVVKQLVRPEYLCEVEAIAVVND
ncbi:MAG TPA: RidA family protein [Blastocatellia bacterium]|nr:RidA family protein [Blastocatellia bacterium]